MASNRDIGPLQSGAGRDIGPLQSPGTGPQTISGSTFSIASAEAFGLGSVGGPIDGGSDSIPSAEAFGVGFLSVPEIVGVTSIPSAEAFGVGIVAGPLVGTASIPSEESFDVGTVSYTQTLHGVSIASAESFDEGTVSNVIDGGSASIPSAEAFGVGHLDFNIYGEGNSITSQESFGSGAVLSDSEGETFRIFLDGVWQKGFVPGSLTGTKQLNFSATTEFEIYDEPGLAAPVVGEDVKMYIWNKSTLSWYLFFGGQVNQTQLSKMAGNATTGDPTGLTEEVGRFFWVCDNVDYGTALSRRIVVKKYLQAQYGTVNSILADLAATYLVPEGISVVLGDDPGITVPDISFNYVTLKAAITTLANLCDYNWQVDWDKNFLFAPDPALESNAPFDITDTNENGRYFRITGSAGLYRNRQYIQLTGGQGVTTITRIYQVPVVKNPLLGDPYYVFADGANITDAEYNGLVGQITNVQKNGVNQEVIPFGATDAGGAIWYQQSANNLDLLDINFILTNDPASLPGIGDVMSVTFTLNTPPTNVVVVQNDAQIAARAAIEGGSGYWDNVYQLNGNFSSAFVTEFALALLARFSVMAQEVNYEHDEIGLECGMVQQITLAQYGLSAVPLIVENIQFQDIDGLLLRQTVKVSNQVQQTDAMAAMDRLIARITSSQQAITWQMIFTLAETVQGIDNPGLLTGTNILPEWILTQGFTLIKVQISFKHPPTGASIKLNINNNGTPITATPLEYTVAGGVQIFTIPVDAIFAVGSAVTVDVVQVGSDEQGRDGTITMLGSVT